MKFAIFALLLILESISCQAVRGTVENCVTAVQADVTLINKIIKDVKAGDQISILLDLLTAKQRITKTKDTCTGLDIKDVLTYVYAHLSQAQKDCITEVFGLVFSVQSVIADAKEQNWSDLISDVQTLISGVDGIKDKCQCSLIFDQSQIQSLVSQFKNAISDNISLGANPNIIEQIRQIASTASRINGMRLPTTFKKPEIKGIKRGNIPTLTMRNTLGFLLPAILAKRFMRKPDQRTVAPKPAQRSDNYFRRVHAGLGKMMPNQRLIEKRMKAIRDNMK